MLAASSDLATRIRESIAQSVVGSEDTVFGLLLALYARGHALIEGVPGTGKTLAVRALAAAIGGDYRRVQFTPDLMPSDLVGTTVFNVQDGTFSIRPGPVVANVLLADEINRTPPKTQAALLEAMEEARVTIDGTPIALPEPFFVCATQNPIEYEGTYPLPEAQLDRFLVKIAAQYPAQDDELLLLSRVARGFDARRVGEDPHPVASCAEIVAAQSQVRAVHVADPVQRYIYDLIAATRAHRRLTLGASPRAGVALLVASQAAALLDGRSYVTPDDVKRAAPFVLPHRLIVEPQAEIDGVRPSAVIDEILNSVPVPREAS